MTTLNPEPSIVDLNVRRRQLTEEQLTLERQGCPYNPQLSEADNAIAQQAHQAKIADLIREQLSIIAAMRKTSAGPAKAGTKRRSKAVDLDALNNSLFS